MNYKINLKFIQRVKFDFTLNYFYFSNIVSIHIAIFYFICLVFLKWGFKINLYKYLLLKIKIHKKTFLQLKKVWGMVHL